MKSKQGWWVTGPVSAALALASILGGLSGPSFTTAPDPSRVLGVSASRSAADTIPPAMAVAFPTANGSFNAAAWAEGCKTVGVCGSADDAGRVQAVEVALLQASSGTYWTGSAFTATTVQWLAATGTKSWQYGLPRPVDGGYTLSVRAVDAVGNTGRADAVFTIDTVSPPAPTIIAGPENPTIDTSAAFQYANSESSASLQCKLDKGSFTPCGSGSTGTIAYTGLKEDDHSFLVWAVDAAGNAGEGATWSWTVAKRITFPISGTTGGALAPGLDQPLNLVFTNPQNFAVRIVDVSIVIQDTTTRTTGGTNAACSGTENFTLAQPFTGSVVVPANGTVMLSDSISPSSRPRIAMRNLATNQDGCKNTRFDLSYVATAVKA